nr:ABC transporter ATP-binding protein [Actinopolymorpha pittospori]
MTVAGLGVRAGGGPLVDDVSFTIDPGERVGLVGESGSGKSLTALAVMGLLPEGLVAQGSVRLAEESTDLLGADERALSKLRGQAMSMVFQEPMSALNPVMRVGDQVAEVLRIHQPGLHRAASRSRAVDLLAKVRLPDPARAARAYPHQLSGGQRQRVVIAIALANDPDLLICDEPTSALDVTVQAQVLDLIVAATSRSNTGLLFITHDLAVVATVCSRVLVMHDGVLVENGPVSDVFRQPRHPYTRALLDAAEPSSPAPTRHLNPTQRPSPTQPDPTPRPDGTRPDGTRPDGTRPDGTRPDGTRRPDPDGLDSAVEPAEPAPHPGPAPVIELRDLSRVYRRPRTSLRSAPSSVPALRDVSFDIASGQRFGIVGESGSGKSTLVRLLAGLDQPTAGSVRFAGRRVDGVPERRLRFLREDLQLVFQDPSGSLDPRMRVGDIVAEPLVAMRDSRLRRTQRSHRTRVDELLAAVGLPADAAERYPHQFSGGQRQRISLARALAPAPKVLVADEPVSALDASVRAQILDLLASLADTFELTLVFVSHDLSVVRQVCDTVAVLHEGRVVELGPTERIFTAPEHPYTQRLIAAVPSVSRALSGTTVHDLTGDKARLEASP